jgi:ubiquinone/menaquinone biosynthesis C-methylase UbiE
MELELMSYLARHLYTGEAAVRYEALRTTSPVARRIWKREFSVVESIVRSFPARSRVLDLPCGTGRFHPLLTKYGCELVGGDISADMIRQASLKSPRTSSASLLALCDAECLPFKDRSFDYVLCMRFFNLVPPETASAVLKEIGRISSRGVIVQIRFRGQRPLRRLATDLRRAAGSLIRNRFRDGGQSVGQDIPQGVQKRFPLREFGTFTEMAQLAGLVVRRVYSVSPLLEPDPLSVCVLDHRGGNPERR